jgi:hypothetical protein
MRRERKRPLPSLSSTPAFVCRDWGNQRKTTVKIAGLSAEIMSWNPPGYEAGMLPTRRWCSSGGLRKFFPFLFFCYLTTLSVSLLYSVGDGMINEYTTDNGMRIGKGNRSTRIKPIPVLFCPPKISHNLTRDWTWAAKVDRAKYIYRGVIIIPQLCTLWRIYRGGWGAHGSMLSVRVSC